MKKYSIIDYGLGNLASLKRAFEKLGINSEIISSTDKIKTSDVLILPGDGAFKVGMEQIRQRKLTRSIKSHFKNKKPILGICLGMQLFFSKGYEFGACRGLDLLKGKVVKFPEFRNQSVKIPHIGWNYVDFPQNRDKRKTVYFVHSYICQPENKKIISGVTDYAGFKFPSIVKYANIYGCQFHPEKSGHDGLSILKDFINNCEND